jgi:O-antigen chain-terminating methyltransferase
MLRDMGFRTRGVDIDDGMLKSAIDKKLDVLKQDGLEFLRSLDDGSVAVLTAFHVLEHLSFERVLEFFIESRRVLRPGGLLVAETPNPENLHVATTNFYLDHTHVRPIPILQMANLARYTGYERYSIVRLQEQKDLYAKDEITFKDLFYGVSKDYALIAQQDGDEALAQALDHPMRYETGISLDELIKRLDRRLDVMSRKAAAHDALLERLRSVWTGVDETDAPAEAVREEADGAPVAALDGASGPEAAADVQADDPAAAQAPDAEAGEPAAARSGSSTEEA